MLCVLAALVKAYMDPHVTEKVQDNLVFGIFTKIVNPISRAYRYYLGNRV